MKLTVKLFLIVCLFTSAAFAEGDMPGGGFADGDMPGGGIICTDDTGNGEQPDPSVPDCSINAEAQDGDSIMSFVEDYLKSLFE